MDKIFKGRVIAEGNWEGKCVVTTHGFNTLASVRKSIIKGDSKIIVSDQNNLELFNKNITGMALCLPKTIGSTTGGLVLQTICSMKLNPAAMLFSEHIDSLAASGVVLARIWDNSDIIVIDQLGKEFIDYVKTGMTVVIDEAGMVVVKDAASTAYK